RAPGLAPTRTRPPSPAPAPPPPPPTPPPARRGLEPVAPRRQPTEIDHSSRRAPARGERQLLGGSGDDLHSRDGLHPQHYTRRLGPRRVQLQIVPEARLLRRQHRPPRRLDAQPALADLTRPRRAVGGAGHLADAGGEEQVRRLGRCVVRPELQVLPADPSRR